MYEEISENIMEEGWERMLELQDVEGCCETLASEYDTAVAHMNSTLHVSCTGWIKLKTHHGAGSWP